MHRKGHKQYSTAAAKKDTVIRRLSSWWGTYVSGLVPSGIYVSSFPPLCHNYWRKYFSFSSEVILLVYWYQEKINYTLASNVNRFCNFAIQISWSEQVLFPKNKAQSEKWIRFHPEIYAWVADNYEQIFSRYHKVTELHFLRLTPICYTEALEGPGSLKHSSGASQTSLIQLIKYSLISRYLVHLQRKLGLAARLPGSHVLTQPMQEQASISACSAWTHWRTLQSVSNYMLLILCSSID